VERGTAHDHEHPHPHVHNDSVSSEATDLTVPDAELSPIELSRRGFLRTAGLLGVGAAAGAAGGALIQPLAAAAHNDDDSHEGLLWVAGDHHTHTQYSGDAQYRVIDHVRHASAFGLGWMVITDHGSVQHAKIGVEKVNPDIVAARKQVSETLVFQGLEWNIPGAEHGTVFVHPGPNEVAVLRHFENAFDGVVTGTTANNPTNEALAISGVKFLADAVKQRRVNDAAFFANHPARKGIDSPHEIRAWRDADPQIALGFEGAPGHQAAGIKAPDGLGSARGFYDFSPTADSFPGYPLESYRTWGGFDWMTATVGGLWDSLLAEGKPWWITANSDSHMAYGDTSKRGPNSDFNTNGFYNDPVYGQPAKLTNGDFWPGYYSRTHVGAIGFSYKSIMDGLRKGRILVDHGRLVSSVDVSVFSRLSRATLGGVLTPRRGSAVDLEVTIGLANLPNWAQFVPTLARVDLIVGAITGTTADRDGFTAPNTKVVKSFEVNRSSGSVKLTYSFGPADQPFYLRLRAPTASAARSASWGRRSTQPDRRWMCRAMPILGWTSGSIPTRSSSSRFPERDESTVDLLTFATVGLDLGHRSVTEAEHWLQLHAARLGADVIACTHFVRDEARGSCHGSLRTRPRSRPSRTSLGRPLRPPPPPPPTTAPDSPVEPSATPGSRR
jgi:hypothetical protein